MTPDQEQAKAFSSKASAIATAPKEASNWGELPKDMDIWNAYSELWQNQKSFFTAESIVGMMPMGMMTTPEMRDDVVNFVNDGSAPAINTNDLKGSLQYGVNIMKTGMDILNSQGIQVQQSVQSQYNLYNAILTFLNNQK